MSQRRFHSKSRHGCLQCKKNRTKCDENRPKCGRCERIGVNCSLIDQPSDWIFIPAKDVEGQKEQTDTNSADSGSNPSSTSKEHSNDSSGDPGSFAISTPSTEQPNVEAHFTDVERERLRLMAHWTLHTSKSISDITIPEDRDQSLWSDWVTELALENDFLLHGLLSLSALHFALCDISRQKYTMSAIHHHGLGIALFRPFLSNIAAIKSEGANRFDAAFACSCIVTFYSFGIQRFSESGMDPIANIHQVLVLLRRSAVIVKSDHEALLRSRWSVLLLPIPPSERLPDEIEDMLSKLLQRTSLVVSTATEKDIYTSAIQTLRNNLSAAVTYGRAQLTLTLFPILSPTEFWEMVCVGEPLALAILANYAVALYWLRDNIWMQGWGEETVDAVREALPPEWHDCIAWALRETGRT
ncbi:hypothetical protein NA57DRAFT_60262 [Rhizodiscina lignyota]|uniref:Zn(2)-C6 fungal-type domain-containing protein n=1 Tax=Rhizodiscina lignyota TaxID=1504668 RepID=A0A9P4I498_9PEZI|nr:hypothetical protein NA57DRAFT_60262 [Rhizodiscina lignyota]